MNYKKIKSFLHGPVFSIITPFNKKQQIDFLKLKKYIKYLYDGGAKSFFLMVYNSRLGLLSEDEIIKLNIFCIKEVKKLNKNNVIICAEPYHGSTKKSIDYVKLFKKNGADLVSLIFGEKYYSDQQVYEHFKSIHDNTNCALLLHQQILENGKSANPPHVLYNLDLLERIANLKRFIAMKEDAKNDKYTKKISLKLSKKIVIITSGNGKRQWMEASKHGCQSWLSGVSNLDAKIALDFYKHFKEGNKKKVDQIIENIEDPFFKIKKKYGWHLTIKAFLQAYNIFPRFERSPLMMLSHKDYSRIKNVANSIKNKCNLRLANNYFNFTK